MVLSPRTLSWKNSEGCLTIFIRQQHQVFGLLLNHDLPEWLNRRIEFAPSLLGRPAEQRQHDDLFWVFYEGQGARALRWGEWKAIEQPLYTPLRLYDLESDIGEQHDLASDQPEIVAHMRKRMDESYTPSARWQLPKPKPAK